MANWQLDENAGIYAFRRKTAAAPPHALDSHESACVWQYPDHLWLVVVLCVCVRTIDIAVRCRTALSNTLLGC